MIATVTLNPSLDEWVELDALRVGELNRASGFARYPGGKGINVSRVVQELGGRTLAVGLAGGPDGRILSDLLEDHRIRHRFINVPGTTRNNYQLHAADGSLTQINCPGPRTPAAAMQRLTRALQTISRQAKCVVFSGSLPPGAGDDAYRQLLRRVAGGQTLTVLDSSGVALRAGLAGRPWLTKPNRPEAAELVGERLETFQAIERAARRLAATVASVVIISMGGEGALLAADGGQTALMAAAPTVRVHTTIGAGDSLVAGFVLGWLRTGSLEDALRLGIACGSATAMTSGTELCHRRDVQRLAPRVRIRSLS